MIQSILIAAAMAAAQAPAPAGVAVTQPATPLHAECTDGIGGDGAAMTRCRAALSGAAAELRIEPGAPEPAGCMSAPKVTEDQMVWAYMDWKQAHAGPDSPTEATAAMLEAYPCGWKAD